MGKWMRIITAEPLWVSGRRRCVREALQHLRKFALKVGDGAVCAPRQQKRPSLPLLLKRPHLSGKMQPFGRPQRASQFCVQSE